MIKCMNRIYFFKKEEHFKVVMVKSTVIDIKIKKNILKSKLVLFIIVIILIFFIISFIIKIDNFDIIGIGYFGKNEVITTLDKYKNDRLMFFFDYLNFGKLISLRSDKIENELLKRYSYIKGVKAKYKFPKSFKIIIRERIPAGYILYNDSKLIVDKDGYVIGINNDKVTKKFPLFDGILLEKYVVSRRVYAKDSNKLKIFKMINQSINRVAKKNFINKTKSIDIGDEKKIFIDFGNEVYCNIGSVENIDYKMSVLEKMFEKNIGQAEKGTFDFTLSNDPVFVPK